VNDFDHSHVIALVQPERYHHNMISIITGIVNEHGWTCDTACIGMSVKQYEYYMMFRFISSFANVTELHC